MENQAHKHTSTVADFLAELDVVALMLILIAVVGCQPVVSRSSPNRLSTASTSATHATEAPGIDVGIILAGQTSYHCWPLAELGIDEVSADSRVVSIESSCHCIHASVVRYYQNFSRTKSALRLDLTPGSAVPGEEVRPIHLAVKVTLKLASGKSHSITVDVLQSQLVATTNPADGRKHENF